MDTYGLQRFIDAQDRVYDGVCRELRAGRKTSHWMWFVFPQIAGLGRSPTAMRFAISSLDEARAYLAHPVLGRRLRECASLVNAVQNKTAHEIFGYPDDLKFHSCMTLFAHAASDNDVFVEALSKYFDSAHDSATAERLSR